MRRPPKDTVLEQRIQDGEQLALAGDEGHLLGLAGCQQPLIELTDGWIETGSHQSTHVQSRPHPRSSAPHRPTAAQSAGVAVQGSHADQGGQALSVECAQLGKLGQQRPRQYRTHPRHAPEQGFVLTPCSASLDRLVQIAFDALKFPLQPPHVRLDALLHGFARGGAEKVSFGGEHAHDLAPAGQYLAESANLLVWEGFTTCSPKTGSPSFSVQHGWTAASLVSYNAGHVLIEEALHVAVTQSTRSPTQERPH